MQFIQTFDGLAAARGGSLGVAVARTGLCSATPARPSGAGAWSARSSSPPAAALQGVAGRLADVSSFTATKTGTQAGYDVFAKGPFASSSYVKKVAFPTADGVRAAYSVLFVEKLDEGYQVVVDAETGKQRPSPASCSTTPAARSTTTTPAPPRAASRARVLRQERRLPQRVRRPDRRARHRDHELRQQRQRPRQLVELHRAGRPRAAPGQPDGAVRLPFADHWGTTKCDPTSYPQDQEPASTNLFYQHNRIHDDYYRLGFTESAGNFQVDNFGKDGNPGDAIQGLVQAGAVSGGNPTYTGRDNAYMLTLPDGIAPWSGMFLWEPIDDAFEGPCADGDFDAGVIQHEYSHGLSNRYVGSEDGSLGTTSPARWVRAGATGTPWTTCTAAATRRTRSSAAT